MGVDCNGKTLSFSEDVENRKRVIIIQQNCCFLSGRRKTNIFENVLVAIFLCDKIGIH